MKNEHIDWDPYEYLQQISQSIERLALNDANISTAHNRQQDMINQLVAAVKYQKEQIATLQRQIGKLQINIQKESIDGQASNNPA